MSALIFMLLFFFLASFLGIYWPVIVILSKSISTISLQNVFETVSMQTILFTYGQAFLSAVISVIVGVGLALSFFTNKVVQRNKLIVLCEITFFVPSILVVLAMVGVWGPRGWIGQYLSGQRLFGMFGILIAHTFLNFSLVFKMTRQVLQGLDLSEEKTALSLGASRFQTLIYITLPKLKSVAFQSFLLVFLYCSSSFIVIFMLGGGVYFSTLETAIYQAIKVDLDIPLAVSLALIQLAVGLSIQLLRRPLARGNLVSQQTGVNFLGVQKRSLGLMLNTGMIVFLCLLVVLPFLSLIISGLRGFLTLGFIDLISVVLQSLLLGFIVALLSTVVSFSAAYGNRHCENRLIQHIIRFTATIPVAISTMVVGLGLILSWGSYPWIKNYLLGVIIIQTCSILPLGFRIFEEGFSLIDPEIYKTAQSLGANKDFQLLSVEIPLLRKHFILVLTTALGISLGESSSLLLFESQGVNTLSLWMFRLMGKYQFEQAYVVGLVLIVMTIIIFGVREKWQSST